MGAIRGGLAGELDTGREFSQTQRRKPPRRREEGLEGTAERAGLPRLFVSDDTVVDFLTMNGNLAGCLHP
jgi:hypothetical protein